MYHPVSVPASLCLLALLLGCSVSPQPIPVYTAPGFAIAMTYDPRAGSGHSHPATVSLDQMNAVLHGLQLRGRDVVGTFGLLGEDNGTPAFGESEIAKLAPHLVAGLGKASPHDVVTFHLVQRDSHGAPLVTSGGLFVRQRHLYVLLANARTSPSSIQYETTYEPDSRVDPLLPIARFKFMAGLIPQEWRITTSEAKRMDGWDGYLDESKVVVVDLQRLANRQPSSSTAAPILSPAIRP